MSGIDFMIYIVIMIIMVYVMNLMMMFMVVRMRIGRVMDSLIMIFIIVDLESIWN